MNKSLISNFDQKNIRSRDQASIASREFSRLVKVFNKALRAKNDTHHRLECRITERSRQILAYAASLATLIDNIRIYDSTLKRINDALVALSLKDKNLKKKFNSLLLGEREGFCSDFNMDHTVSEDLVQMFSKRKQYIQTLDQTFLQLEDELKSVESITRQLIVTKQQVEVKKEKAEQIKRQLEYRREHLINDLIHLKKNLENSIEEESALIGEIDLISKNVQSHLDIRQDTDQLLFTCLEKNSDEKRLGKEGSFLNRKAFSQNEETCSAKEALSSGLQN